MKVSIAILLISLISVSAYATVMTFKTITTSFKLKATYGIELYEEPECITPITTYNLAFDAQDQILAKNIYVKNTGNIAIKISVRSNFVSYHPEMKKYFNSIFDLDFHTSAGVMKPEDDPIPTYIDLAKGSVFFIQIDSKCYTDNPEDQYSGITIWINANQV